MSDRLPLAPPSGAAREQPPGARRPRRRWLWLIALCTLAGALLAVAGEVVAALQGGAAALAPPGPAAAGRAGLALGLGAATSGGGAGLAAALLALTGGRALRALQRARPRDETAGVGLTPWPLLAGAAVFWWLSLPDIDPRAMTDLGLISVLPPGFLAAFGILILGFGLTLPEARTRPTLALLHVVLLIVMIHGTAPIVYETVRYSWAWKHIGIVDYILRHHAVDPTIASLTAYHNWPGFFALVALLTDAAGLPDAIELARWAPVLFNLLNLAALLLVLQGLTDDARLVWFGAWFFVLTNWVGQDYFAPQALAFVLYLAVLGVCLGWFKPHPSARRPGLLGRAAATEPRNRPATLAQQVALLALVTLLMLVIAASHQLTPFVMTAALALLVVFRRCRISSLPLVMALFTVSWLAWPAAPFVHDNLASIGERFGAFFDNTSSNLLDLSIASPGQALVARIGRAFTAAVGGLALLGALSRLARGQVDLAAGLLAAMPFTMALVHSYDGEILFRIYLFALPFMAFFATMLLRGALLARAAWPATAVVLLISPPLLAGLLVAHFGKDRQYWFSADEVAAARMIYDQAPPGTLLVEGAGNYPSRFANYERFVHVPLNFEPAATRARVLADPAGEIARWLDDDRHAATYVILTRSQEAQTAALGELPPGALPRIAQALRGSPRFTVLYDSPDAMVLTLRPRRAGGSPP